MADVLTLGPDLDLVIDMAPSAPQVALSDAPSAPDLVITVLPQDAPTGMTGESDPGGLVVLPVPGPEGPPGSSGAGYEHVQDVPATVWTITHGLHRQALAVSVFSLDFSVQWDGFTVQPLDPDTCRISFDDPLTGVALIL